MDNYKLIIDDIKMTIRKYMKSKIIINPLFSEKKCSDFRISSNYNETGIDKNIKFSESYQKTINGSDYLFMFDDGGVIQIEYTFYKKMIESACLIYLPCPNEKVYDGFLEEMKTYIRLEYTNDKNKYSLISHPKAHIHIGNYNDFRLAVSRIPILSEFVELILYLNYHEKWIQLKNCEEQELIREVQSIILGRQILTSEDCLETFEKNYFSINL